MGTPQSYDQPRLRSSGEWVYIFESNSAKLLEIPWQVNPELTQFERRAIGRSMQLFQLGENSEGRSLHRVAREYAERSGDFAYVTAMELFIREEQRHARDLGRFLDGEGIPRLRRAWSDSVFRRLRKLAGLELSIAVLLTAELIAQVYYAYLQTATNSRALAVLCEQILRDEARHVEFQAQRLAILRSGVPPWKVRLRTSAQRLLFAGTCVVVWLDHARAVRAGGGDFGQYWRRCWRAFDAAFA